MNYEAFADTLSRVVPGVSIRRHVPLAELTTFQIGGPANIVVEPVSQVEVVGVVRTCIAAGVSYRIIGLGSDLLVSDKGIDDVLIRLAENFSKITHMNNPTIHQDAQKSQRSRIAIQEKIPQHVIYVEAGASNATVADAACTWGLSGFEFACGIPGTIGGAAIMNAGAYDGDFSNVALKVRCIDSLGHVVEVDNSQAGWSYRHSMMDMRGHVVLGAYLALQEEDSEVIAYKMQDFQARRSEKQPLEMPSAGSTFKRPEGYFAGKLIQDAGLRGYSVGGAQVSEKHTGFVVNANNASAQDVCELIAQVQQRVYEHSGVRLEPEVRMWGFN